MQNSQLTYFPKYFTNKAIGLYFILLVLCSVLHKAMPFQFMLFGIVEVVAFFYFANQFTIQWRTYSEKYFLKKLFWTAFIIRICWVIFSYIYFNIQTGQPFEYYAADSVFYNDVSTRIANGKFTFSRLFFEMGVSDSGYIVYLTLIKKILFGVEAILIIRFIKALLGSWMCVLVFRLAQRNFGDVTARIAAIFCLLMPTLIYYCGLHLKELEMTFVVVAFLERTDYILRTRTRHIKDYILPILLILILFTLRTVLGAVAIFSFATAALFSAYNTLKKGKRWIIVLWLGMVVALFLGGNIQNEVERYWIERDQNQTAKMGSLEQRTDNNFVKYATGTIMAPLVFVLPMPVLTYSEEKENQMMLNGANYIKNIIAYFVILAIVLLTRYKQLQNYVLLLVFFIAYSLIIVFSGFLFATRFYMPIIPCFLILGAYGVQQSVISKNKYIIYLFLIGCIICLWSFMRIR